MRGGAITPDDVVRQAQEDLKSSQVVKIKDAYLVGEKNVADALSPSGISVVVVDAFDVDGSLEGVAEAVLPGARTRGYDTVILVVNGPEGSTFQVASAVEGVKQAAEELLPPTRSSGLVLKSQGLLEAYSRSGGSLPQWWDQRHEEASQEILDDASRPALRIREKVYIQSWYHSDTVSLSHADAVREMLIGSDVGVAVLDAGMFGSKDPQVLGEEVCRERPAVVVLDGPDSDQVLVPSACSALAPELAPLGVGEVPDAGEHLMSQAATLQQAAQAHPSIITVSNFIAASLGVSLALAVILAALVKMSDYMRRRMKKASNDKDFDGVTKALDKVKPLDKERTALTKTIRLREQASAAVSAVARSAEAFDSDGTATTSERAELVRLLTGVTDRATRSLKEADECRASEVIDTYAFEKVCRDYRTAFENLEKVVGVCLFSPSGDPYGSVPEKRRQMVEAAVEKVGKVIDGCEAAVDSGRVREANVAFNVITSMTH